MPVLPHGVRVISIGPTVVTGDDPAVREVLGSPDGATSAVKACRGVVADTLVVVTARPLTGVVTVGVGLVAALIDVPAALVGHPGLIAGVTLTLVGGVGSPALLVYTVRVGVAVRAENKSCLTKQSCGIEPPPFSHPIQGFQLG